MQSTGTKKTIKNQKIIKKHAPPPVINLNSFNRQTSSLVSIRLRNRRWSHSHLLRNRCQ